MARTLDRLANILPVMPDEHGRDGVDARRADALVALCSTGEGKEREPDRATVIVHARLDGPTREFSECEVEDGPAVSPESAHRMACNARVQLLVENESELPIRVGRMTREPPAWMVRHLKYRDRECRFPGCGTRRFTQAHHVVWWEDGGPTNLDNMVLLCARHHGMVHKHGWPVKLEPDGTFRVTLTDGRHLTSRPPPKPSQLVA